MSTSEIEKMAPYQIKNMTLDGLRKLWLAMMSPEWDIALKGRPQAEVTRAAKTLLEVHRVRQRLVNKQLAEIRDKLKENEASLAQGKQDIEKTLAHLDKVEKVLNVAAAFLKIVARIVVLAA